MALNFNANPLSDCLFARNSRQLERQRRTEKLSKTWEREKSIEKEKSKELGPYKFNACACVVSE